MSQGRDIFSIRWGVEYAADPAFLGMIGEKTDATLRRLRTGPFETERILVAVLGVCEEVIVHLLEENPARTFRVDMNVIGSTITFTVRCTLPAVPGGSPDGLPDSPTTNPRGSLPDGPTTNPRGSLPDGVATGTFRPHGRTARLLELDSCLAAASERMDDITGELTPDGELTITLVRNLPEEMRRDPPVWG